MVRTDITRQQRCIVATRTQYSIALLAVFVLLVVPLFSTPAPVSAAPDDVLIIGSSVEGRHIEAHRIGSGPRSVVLVGAIHGSEGNSAMLAADLLAYFRANLHLLPPDISLYIVPTLNPDGLARNQRYNANGVDLNRNWATENWQPDTYDSGGRHAGGGGAYPHSEPEVAAMAGWLLSLRDQSSSVTSIFYHSAYPPNGLVLGGSVGAPTTPAYAEVVGYGGSGNARPSWSAYSVTGTAPHWCGQNGIGCFEVELPNRANLNAAQVQRHATAVLAVLVWQQTAPGQRCFAETGYCINGRIRSFWEQHGGLTIFGLPLSPQQEAVIDGVPRQVQWFQRNRLELHPQNAPPYDVLIGRIGFERLEQQGRNWFAFEQSGPQAGCRFFPETGQNVCGDILAAWRSSGLEFDGQRGTSEAEALALFGMPLSAASSEILPDGQSYTVQWFERARFEIHPQNAPPFHVQLGLLGNEMQQAQ